MRFYRCDRCEKEYKRNEYMIDDCKLGMRNPEETALIVELPVDLCDDCRKDFENWFRQPMVDKAFEEARAKQHAHEKGDVTLLGLPDGQAICPVCGLVFDPVKAKTVSLVGCKQDATYGTCPQCGSLFSEEINYINMNKKGGDSDDTTGTQN